MLLFSFVSLSCFLEWGCHHLRPWAWKQIWWAEEQQEPGFLAHVAATTSASDHLCIICGRGTKFYLVSVTVIMVFLSFKTQHNPNFCLLSIKETWGFGQQLSSLRGKWWIPGSTPYGHRAIEKRGYFYPVFPMCSTWDPWSPWNSKAGFQSV